MNPENTPDPEARPADAAGEIAPPPPKPPVWRKTVDVWRRVASWCQRFWFDIKPGPEVRKGAAWGALAAGFAGVVVAATFLESGFGLWVDFLFCLVAAGLLVGVSLLLTPLLLTIARKLPRLVTALIAGFGLILFFAFPAVGIGLAPLACLAAGTLGATIATFLSGTLRQSALKKKIVTGVLFVFGLALSGGIVYFLAYEGTTEGIVKAEIPSTAPPLLNVSNPAEPGPYKTRVVHYGVKGGNPRRPEYNNPDIPTPAVDTSRFFQEFKGWKRWLRKRYWGYGMDKAPLNATVWLPEGAGPFPLVLIVHGNHGMADFSDPGYRYLGEHLASRGFILASVDENFLNGGLFHDPPKQQAVRGWLLLEHLKLWRDWSRLPDNPFHTRIDFDKIALMGHSRGGEAAATAAFLNELSLYPDDAGIKLDYHFPIRSVVAIAPADGQYKPAEKPRIVRDVNYFTIQGANDADVSSFMGSAQWDRVEYPGGGGWFKSELYIYRANHGQFNTVWGRSDAGYPLGWFLNLKPLMDPGEQRRIALVYFTAFLEATLLGRREYLPLFRDYRVGRHWLPKTLYINRYQDASFRLLADFSEDADVETTTARGGRLRGSDLSIWREGRIPWRRGDRGYNGLFLGWNRKDGKDAALKPAFTLDLPPGAAESWKLGAESTLVLSVAALDEDAPRLYEREKQEQDAAKGKEASKDKAKDGGKKPEREPPNFTVELITSTGAAVSRPLWDFGTILPPLKVRFTKLSLTDDLAYNKPAEAAFQTIWIPLSAFAGQPGFDAARLKTIRLVFDKTPAAVILISKIGFE